MFKLNEIKFYDGFDHENKKLISRNHYVNKEIVFDHIIYMDITYVNQDIVSLEQVTDFKFTKKSIKFKDALFHGELYNKYVNNENIYKIHVVGIYIDPYKPSDITYYELNFDANDYCYVCRFKSSLKDSEMEVVIK